MNQQNTGSGDDNTNDMQHTYPNEHWQGSCHITVPSHSSPADHPYNTAAYGSHPIASYLQNHAPSNPYANHPERPMGHSPYPAPGWTTSTSLEPSIPYPPPGVPGFRGDTHPSSHYSDPNGYPILRNVYPVPVQPVRYQDMSLRGASHPDGSFTQNMNDPTAVSMYGPYQQQLPMEPAYPYRPFPQDSPPMESPSTISLEGIETGTPPHTGEDFIQESFPDPTEEHERLRRGLTQVMNSDWRRMHSMEPDENLLLQFTNYSRTYGRWNCCFSTDGKKCDRSTRKKDHAKGHIRWHIDHRPFFCKHPCPTGDPNCSKHYTAMESLKKHQTGRAECPVCGASLLKGNLQRHRTTSCKPSTT